MAVVQSTYALTMPEAVAGSIQMMGLWEGITRTCETVAGIGFGLAVSRGAADHGAIIGGTVAGFLGVTVRDITLEISQVDKFVRYQNMGILTFGNIWVATTGADPAPTHAVYFVAATGLFSRAAGGGIVGPVLGARFVKTGAHGLALVNFGKANQEV